MGTLDRLSPAAENYLLSLYLLREEDVRPTPARIAEYIRQMPAGEGLGTSLPSVLGMLRRMAREGLVNIGADKEVHLTARGNVLAEGMVRRHRLAERMVVDLLGLDLHKAHIEAHRLEHGISSDLEDKIWERLNYPTTCPFGRPIPNSGYVQPPGISLTLDQAKTGTGYIVARLPEEDAELLQFLIEKGVIPDASLSVVEAGRYRGVMVFETGIGETSVSYEAASRIWVRDLSVL